MSQSRPTEHKIKALSKDVVNKIAAGEVIQRPVNAIKELLENCLDAGATNITVSYHQGGLKTIIITDNGHGISLEDLDIVCRRHTTSKLNTFEDLKEISTFGFRGEALASISQVAHVTITSKTQEQQCAYKAEYTNGELNIDTATNQPIKPTPIAGLRGTSIRVEDLFFNIGARRSGFNNHAEESRRIIDVVSKYAVHSAGVSITLRKQSDTKTDVHTPLSQSITDNIRTVYGAKLAKELLSLEHENKQLDYKITAHFTNPNYHEKKSYFILFINKRLVEHKGLKKALSSIYDGYVPKGTHPFIFVSLTINPKSLDVNVHPTKEEVIFLRDEEIVSEIKEMVAVKVAGSDSSRVFFARATTTLRDKVDVASVSKPSSSSNDAPIAKQNTMDAFLTPKKKTREESSSSPIHDDDITPPPSLKKRRVAHFQLSEQDQKCVNEIKQEIYDGANEKLTNIFRKSKYVGFVTAELSLIQFQETLYAVDMRNVSSALMYQLCFEKFANIKKIKLSEPLDVQIMIEASIKLGDVREDQIQEEGAQLAKELEKRADMLNRYFSVEIKDGMLVAVPQLLENYVPPMHRIPELLNQISLTLRDEESDQGCFQSIGIFVAMFSCTCREWELAERDLETESSQSSSQHEEAKTTVRLSGAHGYSQQRLSWTIQHVVFPALRSVFLPPGDFEADKSVQELVQTDELYKMFERC
ncbi:DNA mismatch repair protein MLH1 [Acrasis kona]|uniref:DNA mismatch repair protein MLH1 n=1 Tax=Acrasis kona TaxID=1008807 RepID=A0AAW2YRS7_9EUKA